jgi:hypothetical protein
MRANLLIYWSLTLLIPETMKALVHRDAHEHGINAIYVQYPFSMLKRFTRPGTEQLGAGGILNIAMLGCTW